jgi:hypothetical protein
MNTIGITLIGPDDGDWYSVGLFVPILTRKARKFESRQLVVVEWGLTIEEAIEEAVEWALAVPIIEPEDNRIAEPIAVQPIRNAERQERV